MGAEEVVALLQTLRRRYATLVVSYVVTKVTAAQQFTVLFGYQGNSTQGLAAGGRPMVKWFTGCSAPTSINPEPSAATATATPAAHHGNAPQVTTVTHYPDLTPFRQPV